MWQSHRYQQHDKKISKVSAYTTGICLNRLIQCFTANIKKIDQSSTDRHFGMLYFYENVMRSNFYLFIYFFFFVDTTFWQQVLFVTQISSNGGTSVWRVTTNCCFTADIAEPAEHIVLLLRITFHIQHHLTINTVSDLHRGDKVCLFYGLAVYSFQKRFSPIS